MSAMANRYARLWY